MPCVCADHQNNFTFFLVLPVANDEKRFHREDMCSKSAAAAVQQVCLVPGMRCFLLNLVLSISRVEKSIHTGVEFVVLPKDTLRREESFA